MPGPLGDVFCIRVFGQVIVVLNSLSAIKDLLEKRGEIYADRPSLPIVEMCVVLYPNPHLRVNPNRRLEMDWILPLSNMSGSVREGRRLLDRSLRAASYRHMIQEKTHTFLEKLLASPEDFRHHIEQSVLYFCSIVKVTNTVQPSRKTSHVPHIWV
jgi:hypothetical protein